MKINRQNISDIRQRLQNVLDVFAEANGWSSANVGTINYDDNTFSCKLKVMDEAIIKRTVAGRGEIIIGNRFSRNRTIYTVTGLNGSGRASVQVVTGNGKHYRIKPEALLSMERV